MIVSSLIEHGTAYALIGAFTGFMSGVLGIGGGMIVVPALVYVFHHNHQVPQHYLMHVAAGCSLAIMIFTAMSSIRAHQKKGELLWSIYNMLWPGILIGTVLGALVADLLPTNVLKVIFGGFLILISIKMLFDVHVERIKKLPGNKVTLAISSFVGLLSGMLGVGGGTLIIPFLNMCGVETRKIPGVSALCTLTVAMVGSILFMITGADVSNMPSFSTGYIYWPAVLWVSIPSVLFAPIGAQMTYTLPVNQLKYGMIAILMIAGIDMLI
tara:strand:+ start:162 stop:968 length:807 start_codon:yes stop_codon:yes gene_type:complete